MPPASYAAAANAVTVDLSLRRGARFVTGVMKRHAAGTLGVARSNLIDRLQGRTRPRRGYHKAQDSELVPQIMALMAPGFAAAPDKLYIEGEGSFEFARTASRLMEMQAADWGHLAGAPAAQ